MGKADGFRRPVRTCVAQARSKLAARARAHKQRHRCRRRSPRAPPECLCRRAPTASMSRGCAARSSQFYSASPPAQVLLQRNRIRVQARGRGLVGGHACPAGAQHATAGARLPLLVAAGAGSSARGSGAGRSSWAAGDTGVPGRAALPASGRPAAWGASTTRQSSRARIFYDSGGTSTVAT